MGWVSFYSCLASVLCTWFSCTTHSLQSPPPGRYGHSGTLPQWPWPYSHSSWRRGRSGTVQIFAYFTIISRTLFSQVLLCVCTVAQVVVEAERRCRQELQAMRERHRVRFMEATAKLRSQYKSLAKRARALETQLTKNSVSTYTSV